MSKNLLIHVDGGSRGNPGPAGAGIVITDADTKQPVYLAGLFLGRTTNNVAEYKGLLGGLAKAAELGATNVRVVSDSELLVRQINGQYRVRHANLLPLFEEAQLLLAKFPSWSVAHSFREDNVEADALANKAMDAKANVGDAAAGAKPAAPRRRPVDAAVPPPQAEGLLEAVASPAPRPGTLDVCIVQFDIAWEAPQANFDKLTRMLQGAPVKPGSMLALPEMFSTGFGMNLAATIQPQDRPAERFLADLARRHKALAIGGVASPGAGGKGRNEAVAFADSGKETSRFAKLHPFSYAGEQDYYQAGDGIVLMEHAGAKICPMICYDLRFPEAFRVAAMRGAEVFVVLANWPLARQEHWLAMLRSRAIENQAYVVGVNRTGSSPHNQYGGASCIIGPRGGTICQADDSECLLSASLDLGALRGYRREFPALDDVRKDFLNW